MTATNGPESEELERIKIRLGKFAGCGWLEIQWFRFDSQSKLIG